jgi:hypothetical protein
LLSVGIDVATVEANLVGGRLSRPGLRSVLQREVQATLRITEHRSGARTNRARTADLACPPRTERAHRTSADEHHQARHIGTYGADSDRAKDGGSKTMYIQDRCTKAALEMSKTV